MKTYIKITVFVFFFLTSVSFQELIAQNQNNSEIVKGSNNSLKKTEAVKKFSKKKGVTKVKRKKALRFRNKRKAAGKCYRSTICNKTNKKNK